MLTMVIWSDLWEWLFGTHSVEVGCGGCNGAGG